MATDNFIFHPTVNPESLNYPYVEWTPDSLLQLTPAEQDQAGYFRGLWQLEPAWASTSVASLPVGLLDSSFRPCEDADAANGHDWQQEPPFTISTEALTSYRPDTSFSSPITLSGASLAAPTSPGTVSKRRGRPAHPSQRRSHNEIEARYRETVNAAILHLQQAVPPSVHADYTNTDDCKRQNFTKAAVIVRASTHIRHLEAEYCELVKENNALRTLIAMHQPLSE